MMCNIKFIKSNIVKKCFISLKYDNKAFYHAY